MGAATGGGMTTTPASTTYNIFSPTGALGGGGAQPTTVALTGITAGTPAPAPTTPTAIPAVTPTTPGGGPTPAPTAAAAAPAAAAPGAGAATPGATPGATPPTPEAAAEEAKKAAAAKAAADAKQAAEAKQAADAKKAQETAAAAAAAAPAPAPAAAPKTYTVVRGDTLSGIAAKLGLGGYQGLYDRNKALIGANPNLIKPGQVLTIP
jgi:nucleoid-associated protein YgaU